MLDEWVFWEHIHSSLSTSVDSIKQYEIFILFNYSMLSCNYALSPDLGTALALY